MSGLFNFDWIKKIDPGTMTTLIGGIIVLSVGYVWNKNKENKLNEYPTFAPGVITEINRSPRFGGEYYDFFVDNKTYQGKDAWSPWSKIRVGDSIIVKYESQNPKNNELYCYFEYTLDRSKLPDTVFYRQPIDNQRRPLK